MFYDAVFLMISIVYLPALFLKGKFHGEFLQRFGIYPGEIDEALSGGSKRIWIHAVSVGEVLAAKPLIDLITRRLPDRSIVLTTTTITGNVLAKQTFGKTLEVIYFPLDFSWVIERCIRKVDPAIFGMMETEIWPNLITGLSARRIPVVLLNGRISDGSLGGYMAIRRFLRPVLRKIDRFCMQTDSDARRVIEIGAPSEAVTTTGNMKFDEANIGSAGAPREDRSAGIRKRLLIEDEDKVLIAGSTHPGEEEIVLRAFEKVRRQFRGLKLIIAPRHIHRISEIERMVAKDGLTSVRISRLEKDGALASPCPVMLLDTIGQLKMLYEIAACVFIGGSLVKKGGHNLIEPAVYGKPIFCGPHMDNFRGMTRQFVTHGAVGIVETEHDLANAFRMIMEDPVRGAELGGNARKLVSENHGAANRNLAIIEEILTRSGGAEPAFEKDQNLHS